MVAPAFLAGCTSTQRAARAAAFAGPSDGPPARSPSPCSAVSSFSDQDRVALIRDGVITLDSAMGASTNPHDLTVELRRLGLVA